jgi:hypothetical protein
MSDYAIEMIRVKTPAGIKLFFTCRRDYRTDEELASEVPRYFETIRVGLAGDHLFVNRVYLATGLTEEAGKAGVDEFIRVYKNLGFLTLNV